MPVTCAGVVVNPDIVTADEDGVAVVPRWAADVLKSQGSTTPASHAVHREVPVDQEAVKQFGRFERFRDSPIAEARAWMTGWLAVDRIGPISSTRVPPDRTG